MEFIRGKCIDSESKKLDSAVKGFSIGIFDRDVDIDCLILFLLKLNVGETLCLDIAKGNTPGDGPQTLSDLFKAITSSSDMNSSFTEALLLTLISGKRLLWYF